MRGTATVNSTGVMGPSRICLSLIVSVVKDLSATHCLFMTDIVQARI
jgi:hypothetical protein